jgi:hypothetical protein
MIAVAAGLWGVVAILGGIVSHRKGTPALGKAARYAVTQGRALMFRLPLALLAASFLIQILPVDKIAALVGPQSGLSGIVIASILGGLLPGGPMTSFPIALVVFQGGAGPAQIVALIAGWSIFALHRLLAYEAPIMGWRFVALRTASTFLLPVFAGLLAQAGLVATGALTFP